MRARKSLEARVPGHSEVMEVSHEKITVQFIVRESSDTQADLSAIRYLGPSFSNSAITQSVTQGIPEEKITQVQDLLRR